MNKNLQRKKKIDRILGPDALCRTNSSSPERNSEENPCKASTTAAFSKKDPSPLSSGRKRALDARLTRPNATIDPNHEVGLLTLSLQEGRSLGLEKGVLHTPQKMRKSSLNEKDPTASKMTNLICDPLLSIDTPPSDQSNEAMVYDIYRTPNKESLYSLNDLAPPPLNNGEQDREPFPVNQSIIDAQEGIPQHLILSTSSQAAESKKDHWSCYKLWPSLKKRTSDQPSAMKSNNHASQSIPSPPPIMFCYKYNDPSLPNIEETYNSGAITCSQQTQMDSNPPHQCLHVRPIPTRADFKQSDTTVHPNSGFVQSSVKSWPPGLFSAFEKIQGRGEKQQKL